MQHFAYIINQQETFDIKLLHGGFGTAPASEAQHRHLDRHVLYFVFDGEGSLFLQKRSIPISKGDLTVIPSGTYYATTTNNKQTCRLYYISFTCTNLAPLLQHAGLTKQNPLIHIATDYIERMMKRIFKLMSVNSYSSIMKANILFCEIFYKLFTLVPENNVSQKKAPPSYVQQAEEFIKKHYATDISVNDVSQALHISRTYLSAIFKKDKGTTLQNYLTTHRVVKSYNLLINTELSITEIAIRVGFNNSVSYYRQFKSITGISPKQYRLIYRNEIAKKCLVVND